MAFYSEQPFVYAAILLTVAMGFLLRNRRSVPSIAATGATRWTADLGAAPRGEPALAEGQLYVATADGRLLAFDTDACAAAPSPCAPTWTANAGAGPLAGQPAVAGGVVVVGTAEGAVRAYDAAGCGAATCDPLWTGTVAGPVILPPIVSNGQILVLDDTDRLTAFAPAA